MAENNNSEDENTIDVVDTTFVLTREEVTLFKDIAAKYKASKVVITILVLLGGVAMPIIAWINDHVNWSWK